ncbi:MAG: glycosyltransferase [Thermoplasmata archaeon]|nr:glycosyltransferase [Thermoplasmata archaeon]
MAGEPPRRETPADPLRIGFFGVFYPHSERAGSFSTSLVWELARSPRVALVRVFGPSDAVMPPGGDPARLKVEGTWEADRPSSLLRSLGRMWSARAGVDVFVFSIYVSAFGRRAIANAIGMLVPTVLRVTARKPVLVYMHNFFETQDTATLGFQVGGVARLGVRTLERIMTASTRVVVPLESMRVVVAREIGGACEVLVLPYLEAIFAATRPDAASAPRPAPPPPVRILLFGYWGPQKDLTGSLRVLEELVNDGAPIDVTIAGEANPGFPEFGAQLEQAKSSLPKAQFHFLGRVDEEEVFPLARRHHILLLPYRATGGISGVMNVGALADLDLVAYDVPQLREFARDLGEKVTFVPAEDAPALRAALRERVEFLRRPGAMPDRVLDKVAAAREGVDRFIALLRPAAP